MNWFPFAAGAAILAFAAWGLFKGGGPPTDDHGHDKDQASRMGGG